MIAEHIVPIYYSSYQGLKALFNSVGPEAQATAEFHSATLEKLNVIFMTLKIMRRLMASGSKKFGAIPVFSVSYALLCHF